MRIDVLTLFPEMFHGVVTSSILGRAVERGLIQIELTNFRDFTTDRHNSVDDSPFGGGAGMVLKPDPLYRAMAHIKEATANLASGRRTVILDPAGEIFTQDKAKELAGYGQLIFICGHYEGFDARVYDLADERISLGNYVLTGGELPAMVIIDATARMLDEVLGDSESAATDSFYAGLLGYPQYTRPRDYEGMRVPPVLLSGNHADIARWRREQSLLLTAKYRPDLLVAAELSAAEREFLKGCGAFDSV